MCEAAANGGRCGSFVTLPRLCLAPWHGPARQTRAGLASLGGLAGADELFDLVDDVLGELALPRAHDAPNGLLAGDDRDHSVDVGLPDRGGHVGARDPDTSLLVDLDRVLVGKLAQARAVRERQAALDRKPRKRAVHRAGIEVAEVQPPREPL